MSIYLEGSDQKTHFDADNKGEIVGDHNSGSWLGKEGQAN